jgi:sec-independent protein translocase protein TatA
MGPVGVQEMIVIFLVALVLFGPKKLPELGRTIGKALTEFRRAQSELKATFDVHMRELERETGSLKEVSQSIARDIYHQDTYPQYDSSYHDSGVSQPESPVSTAANPSTVDASATQGADSIEPHPGASNGAVPRTEPHIAAAPVEQPAHEPHVNG